MSDPASSQRATIVVFALLALLCGIPAISFLAVGTERWTLIAVWAAGAGLVGLLSGYTTGASEQTGTASEFLKFVSGGVLVPLIGGLATLVRQPSTTIERSVYSGTQLMQKTTEVILSNPNAPFVPLAVLGSFLIPYCALAVIGILIGISHRQAGISIKLGK